MRVKNAHATSPSRAATEGGKAPGPVASTGEAGVGGALRSSVTEGASASVHSLALADAEAFADVVDVGVDNLVHVAESVREVA